MLQLNYREVVLFLLLNVLFLLEWRVRERFHQMVLHLLPVALVLLILEQ